MSDEEVAQAMFEHLKESLDDRVRMYLGLPADHVVTSIEHKRTGEKLSKSFSFFLKNLIDYDTMLEKMLAKMSDEKIDELYAATNKRLQQIRKEIGRRNP